MFVSLLYLVLINGYATGYEFERASLVWWMWEHWTDAETEWGFGMLVFPLVLFLIYKKRDTIFEKPANPAYFSGFILVCLSLFIYFAGYKANERYFGFASIQLLVGALVVYFFGWKHFFNIWWLWLILGMMWPWLFLEELVSFWLQLFLVKMVSGFLDIIGDSVTVNGAAIMSKATENLAEGERFQLNIEGACSGLRSLFALTMTGLIYVYVGLQKEYKRWILFLLIPVIVIIGNFFRMIILYLGVIWFGAKFAIGSDEGGESAYHIIAGLVVFFVALICLSILVRLLKGEFFDKTKVSTID